MARKQQDTTDINQKSFRIPFLSYPTNRDGISSTKDQRFINFFPEVDKIDYGTTVTTITAYKRPGLTLALDTTHAGEARGLVYWNGQYVSIIGNTVYKGTTSLVTLANSTGPAGIIEGDSATIGKYLFITDGVKGYYITDTWTVNTVYNDTVLRVTINSAGTGYNIGSGLALPIYFPLDLSVSTTPAVFNATYNSSGVLSVEINSGYKGTFSVAPTLSFNWNCTTDSTTDYLSLPTGMCGSITEQMPITFATTVAGLTAGTTYYIKNGGSNLSLSGNITFQVSTTPGGAAVDLTADTSIVAYPGRTGTSTEATATAYLNGFPTPHIPTPTFLDGYIIIPDGQFVYNCEIDTPANWDSSNFLAVESFSDDVVSLARQNNQIVAFGTTSTEFLYDAANATGSPLARNDSTVIQIGCAAPYAIYQNESTCIYVGQSQSGGRTVQQITGFQSKQISTEAIDRLLDQETSLSTAKGYGLRTMGHLFFVLHLPTLARTLVYDTEDKLWHEWSSNNLGNHTTFTYNFATDSGVGKVSLLHNTTGKIYYLDPDEYTDAGTTILAEIHTKKYDFDVYVRKFLKHVYIVGDLYTSGTTIDLAFSDDDYTTWSAWKTINMSSGFPRYSRLGSFRRRAFKLLFTADSPCRIESLECFYSVGVT